MRCPRCACETRVLEKRNPRGRRGESMDDIPRRRRECEQGHRFSTREIPEDVSVRIRVRGNLVSFRAEKR